MPVAIEPLGLGRVRRTDPTPHVTINGTGFSPANNSVFVGGSPAPPIVQGTTQITVDLPSPFNLGFIADVREIHVPVLVVNNDTGETSDEAWIWIMGDVDEVADEPIDSAVPGPFEVTGLPEVPERFEARDMERLAALIDSLILEIPDGNVLAWDGSKLASPAGLNGGGQVLVVDPAEPTGLRWALGLDTFLRFGGLSNNGVPQLAVAGGQLADSLLNTTENWAFADGTLDLISLDLRSVGGGTLVRVRVLVNGAPAFDSGAIVFGLFYVQAISVAVVEGDVVELELTCSVGLGASIGAVGGIRLLID